MLDALAATQVIEKDLPHDAQRNPVWHSALSTSVTLTTSSAARSSRASAACRVRFCGCTISLRVTGASGGRVRWRAHFAGAAVQEFDNSAFAGAPASLDVDWLHACIDYLVRRDPQRAIVRSARCDNSVLWA